MSADKFINAIRRALIPSDQAEALAQLPGWGPAPLGDDFTPADENTLALGDGVAADQRGEGTLEVVLQENFQVSSGSLDHQGPLLCPSPDDEEGASPSKADSYDEAFEDGSERQSVGVNIRDSLRLALPTRDIGLDEVQPMTQDPNLDMSQACPELAPESLAVEEEKDSEPGSVPPEAAEKPEGSEASLRHEIKAKMVRKEPMEDVNPPTVEHHDKDEQHAVGVQDTGVATEEPAEGGATESGLESEKTAIEEEDEFQDAVAEPMSSQDTTRRRGRSKETKQVVGSQDTGHIAPVKDPAMPTLSIFPRSSTRTAAISRQVQAAVRAAESARQLSDEPGTSSIYTAATALSVKHGPGVSDSTHVLQRTTRSTHVSSVVAVLKAPPELRSSVEAQETVEVAARAQAQLNEKPKQDAALQERGSQTRTKAARAEHLEGRDSQPGMQPAEQQEYTARDDEKERNEGSLEGSGVQATGEERSNGDNAQLEAHGGGFHEAATAQDGERETVPTDPERKRDTEAAAETANERLKQEEAEPAHALSPRTPHDDKAPDIQAAEEPQTNSPSIHAHHARPQGAAEASRSRVSASQQNDDQLRSQPQVGQDGTDQQGAVQEGVTLGEEMNASHCSDEAAGVEEQDFENGLEPPRASGHPALPQGGLLDQQVPEMTVAELRKRQSNPASFAELVRLWPVKKPRQELQPEVNLLSLAVDAGIWSPPPFYRGKRPQKGNPRPKG